VSLADYYLRSAMAASQVLTDFDQSAFIAKLQESTVGIRFGHDAAASPEARALLDLLVRLTSRLYPRMVVQGRAPSSLVAELVALACNINPNIEVVEDAPATLWVNVGEDAGIETSGAIFIGSSEWTALVSTDQPQPVGASDNPFGAGAAACFAAANVFRSIFVTQESGALDRNLEFPTWRLPSRRSMPLPDRASVDLTLVGAGAVGNAAAWALSRLPVAGLVRLVDPEQIELSNLQRYVLGLREDVDAVKVETVARYFAGSVAAEARRLTWQEFVATSGSAPPRVLVALDSADDRRAVQASLPRWIANAWTQPGDLGVSVHDFLGGACLRCLYLPDSEVPSRDVVLAEGLRVPDQVMAIREILYHDQGAPAELLAIIASRFSVAEEVLQPYQGVALSKLYAEVTCGGAVLPLGADTVTSTVHVPIAHQSALAGVLLAAGGIVDACGWRDSGSYATRVNVMAPTASAPSTQPLGKDPRGICICQDDDWQAAYRIRYPTTSTTSRSATRKTL
jgi:Prokaryotic E2 family C/ThiF family